MWHYDAETIQKVRDGDMQAAQKLYKANMPLIKKFAYRYSFIDAAFSVDDLVQEAWFAVLRAAQRFEHAQSTWTQELIWAIKRQYRDCMRLYRKNRPEMISLNQTAPEDETAILVDRVVDRGANAEIPTLQEDFCSCVRRTLLDELDERTANTIIRHDLEGEDLRSIAQSIHLSYNTTTANRRYALLRLRRSKQLRSLYRDALEIENATYHSSAETCSVLLMKSPRKSKGIVIDTEGGES